ncbi:DUF547 domain-containing protein [Alteromonas sp. 5E99-2]|uniref:DUF547 domain-containing protein n=1 Tax=Alteromonas sp. 5E99-2 TaxID=2817683 RepID=UPI001F61E4CB|nr:DUF547 domain-containing protein [Alteromonas sp. 5E99-2]
MKQLIALSVLLISHIAFADIHEPWNDLLQRHVVIINNGHTSAVDYAAFQKERTTLDNYLTSLSSVTDEEYQTWSKEAQLAFLINAYNAFTTGLVLDEYPNLTSIKDLGRRFSSPWNQNIAILLGEDVSLDVIKNEKLREQGVFAEPLIHFAVTCANVGCPALRNEAYNETDLSSQLNDQVISFLTDRSKNYAEGNTLFLSSFFQWNQDDLGLTFFLQYSDALGLNEEQKNALENNKMRVRYLNHDWSLNGIE